MRIEPLGDSALLVRIVEDYGRDPEKALDAVLGAFGQLQAAGVPGVIELAPAYATVGVFFDPARTGLDALRTQIEEALQKMEPARSRAGTGSTLDVPVCYEHEFAPDLREVAWHAGLSVEEVVERHSSATYRVTCVGFTPGFPYLSGLPAALTTPRRSSPRKEIPAGAVGIGGTQTGIYPRKSPGGWNIIGRTPLSFFEVKREPPALLLSRRPGSLSPYHAGGIRKGVCMNVLLRSAGFLTTVQDLGRTGFRQSGVSLGGALDSHAMRVANALVGNQSDAAGLEVTLGKQQLRFEDTRMVAWCGGAFSAQIGKENLPPGHAGLVAKDQELTMIAPPTGARAWLAISGGIDVPPVLGSRSTDLRGNFGGHQGRALRDGDALPLGRSKKLPSKKRTVSEWSAPGVWSTTARVRAVLRIVRGADWNRFLSRAHTSLLTRSFAVAAASDRMGARLDGPPLDRMHTSDLLSEAVAPGTLQVPPNGEPILLLGDCQTIGGYPKIAHVITPDLPIAAQLCPGHQVRFHEISLMEAQALLRQREEDFARFRVGLSLHFS